MNLDGNSLLASLLVGSVGLVLFLYGKRQGRIPHLGVGMVLLAYPYFIADPLIVLGIAAFLLGGLWIGVRQGL